MIAQELSNNQLSTSSKELAKPTSHKALKVVLATTLSLGVATFAGLYTWRHFQNISEQNSIVAGGVADIIMMLSENSTESEIEKAREAYEALSAAEKKAVPVEALQYLEKQEALLKEDKDFAKNFHDELDTWVAPDSQANNALNDEKYPKLKTELLPAIDRYTAARERAKKYFDDSLEVPDKVKFNRYRRIADEAKGLLDHIDDAVKHEYEYYDEDVNELQDHYNSVNQFLKNPAYDDELKNPLDKIERKIKTAISEEKIKANEFVGEIYDSAIDKENDKYAETTYERLQEFSDQYFTLITTRPRMKKFIDDACTKLEYPSANFKKLIERAYSLLEEDVEAVSTLFNGLSELEERAINPEKETPTEEEIENLRAEAAQVIDSRGKRVENLLTKYRFGEYLTMLKDSINAGEEDASDIIVKIVDYTTHTDQGPEKPGTVCTELEIDALAYRYGSVINSIAKKIIDKNETVIALGGFEKAISLARTYLADDIKVVDSLCAALDALINSDDIPTTLTDQRIVTLYNAYNSYVNRGYRRIQKLAIERGFEEKFIALTEAITRANDMYALLKENNDPLTATATYEQLTSLDDSYRKATTLLKYIIDKIIEKDGVFVDWATAMNNALRRCQADDDNAKRLCGELTDLINSDNIPTDSTDSRIVSLKEEYDSMTLRAKTFADDYGFSTKLKDLLDAITEGNAVYTLAVEYATPNEATCESEDIVALQNRYLANKIIQKVVDKLLHDEKATTWTEIVSKMYEYLHIDLAEAEQYSNYIETINKNTDRSRRMAAADHLYEDISVKANERIIKHTVGYDDFKEYYVSHVQNKVKKLSRDPADIFNQIGELTEPAFDPSAGMASTAEEKLEPIIEGNVIAKFKKEDIAFDPQKYDVIDFGIKLDWLATKSVKPPMLSLVDYTDEESPKVVKAYNFTNDQKNKYVSIDITIAEWNQIAANSQDVRIVLNFSSDVVNAGISVTTIYELMTE